MTSYSQIKELVHDTYVLNYVMRKLKFWKMRIYEPEYKPGCYKIKLYREYASCFRCASLMFFDNDNIPHVYASADARLKAVANETISFICLHHDMHKTEAASFLLNQIKKHKMFKWHSLEFFSPNSSTLDLDELLVEADIKQDDASMDDELFAIDYIRRKLDAGEDHPVLNEQNV